MKIGGLHVNDWIDGIEEYIGETNPGWVKILNHDRARVERAMALSPETRWIGRMYKDLGEQRDYIGRQESGAEQFFRDLTNRGTWSIIDTWEGINEPGNHPTSEYYRFGVRLGELMREAGKTYLCQGCSVGTWSGDESDPMADWKSTWTHEPIRRAGGIHVHEYGAPHMRSEFMWNPAITEKHGGYYTLRYRQVYRTLPEDCRIDLYITECGIDSGIRVPWDIPGQGGWRTFTTPEDYVSQLEWYINCCKEDGFVKAVIPFCTYAHNPTWYTYSMWDGPIRDLWGEFLYNEETDINIPIGWIDVRDALPKHPQRRFVPLPQGQFDEVIIHHSASETMDVWEIAHDHVVNNGWAGIGYHIVIDKEGKIYWCHDLNVQAAHCKYQNDHTVGVCFLGNLNEKWPTEAQLMSGRQVLTQMPFPFTVKGHRDYRATDCPGHTFDEWRPILLGGEIPQKNCSKYIERIAVLESGVMEVLDISNSLIGG
jgi:hypothetical protein